MTFQFINKVWIPQMRKSTNRKVVLMSLATLIFLLTLFQVVMDGMDSVNWVSSGLVPILLISIAMMGDSRGGYTTTDCRVEIQPGRVHLSYYAIDRYDKRGIHTENQTIERDAIEEIQYSKVLQSFRIIGAWSVSLSTQEGLGVRYTTVRDTSEVVLYPPEDQIQIIHSAFESVLGITIIQMDD